MQFPKLLNSYLKAGRGICTCKIGYEGDGTFCQSINPCLNTSVCDDNYSCRHTGPNLYNCVCKQGYNPSNCKAANPCEEGEIRCSII